MADLKNFRFKMVSSGVLYVCMCLILGVVKGQSPGSTVLVELSEEDKKVIVDRHNEIRSSVEPEAADMEIMVWNEPAAQLAANLAKTCVFEHDTGKDRTPPDWTYCGQNLAYSSLRLNFVNFINFWEDQVNHYQLGLPGGSTIPGRVVGHYSQVIWNISSTVGCAMSRCPQGFIFVCNYCPGGNYNRDKGFAYTKGPSASACVNGPSEENEKLCEPPCYGRNAMDLYKSCGTSRLPCKFVPNHFCPRSCGFCAGNTRTTISTTSSTATTSTTRGSNQGSCICP